MSTQTLSTQTLSTHVHTGRNTRVAQGALGIGILIALVISISACAPPQVNLKQAHLARVTTTGFKVHIDLSIFNPNTYTLPLRSVQWRLDLFKNKFTQGSIRTTNQIGAQRTTSVRIPLSIRFSKIALGVKDFMTGRHIPWSLQGQCDFNTPAGPIFVKFANHGTWTNPLRRMVAHDRHTQDHTAQTATSYAQVLVSKQDL